MSACKCGADIEDKVCGLRKLTTLRPQIFAYSGDELKLLTVWSESRWPAVTALHPTLKETRGYCHLPPHSHDCHPDPSLDCILMVSRGDVMTLRTGNGMNENEKVGRREVAGLVTGCRLAGTRCTALASLTLMVNTHQRSQHAVFTYPCIHLVLCGHTLCHCKYVQHCHQPLPQSLFLRTPPRYYYSLRGIIWNNKINLWINFSIWISTTWGLRCVVCRFARLSVWKILDKNSWVDVWMPLPVTTYLYPQLYFSISTHSTRHFDIVWVWHTCSGKILA